MVVSCFSDFFLRNVIKCYLVLRIRLRALFMTIFALASVTAEPWIAP